MIFFFIYLNQRGIYFGFKTIIYTIISIVAILLISSRPIYIYIMSPCSIKVRNIACSHVSSRSTFTKGIYSIIN